MKLETCMAVMMMAMFAGTAGAGTAFDALSREAGDIAAVQVPQVTAPASAAERGGYVSTNYQRIEKNDDGSESIVEPRFAMNGTHYYYSSHQDVNQVCRRFGYDSAVPHSALYSSTCNDAYGCKNNYGVVLGADGNFGKFIPSDEADPWGEKINMVACKKAGAPAAASRRAEIQRNDDGSVSLLDPRFRINGTDYPFSIHQDGTAICRLFGYKEAVSGSAAYSDTCNDVYGCGNYTVALGEDGKFAKFVGSIAENDFQNEAVDGLSCR